MTVGESLGTTLSFGLRAPNYRDLSSALLQHAQCSLAKDQVFYCDSEHTCRDQFISPAGEISQQVLTGMSDSLSSMVCTILYY